MSHPQIEDFLQAFSGDARYCLSIPVLWSVSIDGVSNDSINYYLQLAGEKWRANINPISMTKNNNILPAQSVTIPTEGANFGASPIGENSGGFLPGYVLNSRQDFLSRTFSVNFLETRKDLEHEYFRPWIIALSIKGLIESGSNLKADITVKQYTNNGELRKGYIFRKVFPTAIEGLD